MEFGWGIPFREFSDCEEYPKSGTDKRGGGEEDIKKRGEVGMGANVPRPSKEEEEAEKYIGSWGRRRCLLERQEEKEDDWKQIY
jgi:hypothetical protein